MTTKQAIAIKEITENHRSVHSAMKRAGYSPNTYSKPKNLTTTKAFREIMEAQGISDERLATIIDEGLGSMVYVKTERVEGVGKNRLKTEEIVTMPDVNARHKYLETSLRLKGHDRAPAPNIAIIPIYGGLSGRPEDVPLPGHDSDPQDLQTQATH